MSFQKTICPLYGDYERLIDLALNGDPNLKQKVAIADAVNRGGLEVLSNAIKNRKVSMTGEALHLYETCKADQTYYEARNSDLRHITIRGNGRYQVKVVVEHNRYSKTFFTLTEAQRWRDGMLTLGVGLE